MRFKLTTARTKARIVRLQVAITFFLFLFSGKKKIELQDINLELREKVRILTKKKKKV